MKMKLTLSVLVAFAFSASLVAAQNKVAKDTVPGINNYAHIETTVACAGAITPGSVAEIKKMGYASIINLREATEPGADIDAEKAAADKAGIRFVHIPFNGNKPSTEAVDQFLKAIPDLRAGESITITYIPGQGTVVKAAASDEITVAGKDFADALFSVWLGPQPVDDELKNEMLRNR